MDVRNLFTIGEMGGLFCINIRTLRYYDEIGLLKPEVVDERTGYRYYSSRQFERMNTIKYLRTLNMPLDKIKAFFENRDTSVMEQILKEQLEETREQLSRLHSIERKLSNRLFQLHYAMNAPLERIERKTFPARPAAFLKKEISQGESLEYPIRELERTSQLPPAMFLGKVGVSISREDLRNSRFHHFSGIFVLLEEEDNYQGERAWLPEGEYLTILYAGTHQDSAAYYERLLVCAREQGLECSGDSVEITWIDSGFTDDQDKYVTELQIPVVSRTSGGYMESIGKDFRNSGKRGNRMERRSKADGKEGCRTAWTLRFRVPDTEGVFFSLEEEGEKFLLEYREGILKAVIQFPARPEPVTLTGMCRPENEAVLHFTGFRLELLTEGVLADEEWTIGQVDIAGICSRGKGLELRPELGRRLIREEKEEAFTGIQGWKPEGKNVHLGDCMPFYHDGTFHLFYLFDRRGHKSKWGLGAHQWAHAASRDLVHWIQYPLAIGIDDEAEGSICTGSVIFHEGTYYAFYAVRMCDGSPAQLTAALSQDGIHFKKSHKVFALQPPYDGASARDPKVIRDESGVFHMFVTTSLLQGKESRGCLAHLVSGDLVSWEPVEPLVVLDISDQPECSDYFRLGNFYYLVYSNFGTARYFFSSDPFGPWQAPEENVVVEPAYRVPKAAGWKNGRILFAGFYVDPDVDYGGTVRFYEAEARKDGSLKFLPVPEMEEEK